MTAWQQLRVLALLWVLGTAMPARADVTAQTPMGFVSRNVLVVAATPATVWRRLVTPSAWWSPDHTFSGDAANLRIDPVAGGCFCERLPAEAKGAKSALPPRGGVEHMRVVFVDHAKALRMIGALGPLQSEAVSATLTITLTPVEGGTRVIFEYVVGGYMRYPGDKIAPAVDTVMGNQLISLGQPFGPAAAVAPVVVPAPDEAPAAPVAGSRGLDKKGVLLPRGKVWSLPSSAPPPAAPPTEPMPNLAPVAAAAPEPSPVPAKKRARPKSAPVAAALPEDSAPAVTADAAPVAAPPVKPAPPPKLPAKKPAKPTKAPAPTSDEPSKDSVDSAFDAAFGGAPRPPAQ